MNYLFFILVISFFIPVYIFGGSKSYNFINLSTKYQPIPDGFTLNYSLSMSVGKVLKGNVNILRTNLVSDIVGYGITETSSSKTSFSSGYQLGVNYFISDNLSFHIQYENNLPFSSDVESIKVITWGFQYWF